MIAATRRAFTLAELVVVVALIALLTVGIGRLFAGISEAVGRGMATSELDATARAIEESLRQDFELLNRMDSEDTFLVIRAVELGGDPDRPIYLSLDDREADVRDGLDPYESEASRAITTRLDEMAFLVRAPGAAAFRSQQDDGLFTGVQPQAEAARVYYGHGLRPRIDPNWPPENPEDPNAPEAPIRQFISDGYFGSRPGADGRGFLPDGVITGRNEYAEDWILARQALLLYGPRATGVANPTDTRPTFGTDREYAPYVRDLENLSRFWDDFLNQTGDAPSGDALYAWPGPIYDAAQETISGTVARPDPRLISHGRVDVSAQSLESVRRWLEGERPNWDPGEDFYEATPYDNLVGSAFGVSPDEEVTLIPSDRYGLSAATLRNPNDTAVLRWLWKRSQDFRSTTGATSGRPSELLDVAGNGPLPDLTYNLIGIRSAIAGVLTRPLVEFEPPPSPRSIDASITSGSADADRLAAEQDAAMDTHAVLAPHCSRFELAWSDGSYWVDDVDVDGDGQTDFREGDLVWFDPTRRDPDNEPNDDQADRMTFAQMWERFGDQNDDGAVDAGSPIRWATLYTDPEALRLDNYDGPLGGSADNAYPLAINPEVGFGDFEFFSSTPTFDSASVSPVGRRLWTRDAGDFAEDAYQGGPSGTNPPYYNPNLSGGVPTAGAWPDAAPGDPSDDMNEYLAVWPFRVPTSTGEWGEAYEKNVWLRVRYTLHDPQSRVPGGRTYEVVLHMHPRDEQRG